MPTKTIALLSSIVVTSILLGCGAATKSVVAESITGSEGPIHFKSGVQIQLILSDNVAKKSWKSDGEQTKDWVRPGMLVPPIYQPKWFIVRVDNCSAQDPPAIAFRFDNGEIMRSSYSSLEDLNTSGKDKSGEYRLYGTENKMIGKSTANLEIGLADGPWLTVGAYKNDNGKFILDQGSAFNLFVMPEGGKNIPTSTTAPPLPQGVESIDYWFSATVDLPKTIAKHDYRLIALGWDGKQLQSSGQITGKDETIPYQYWFVGRMSDVNRIELQIRHYGWTEFKNVRLNPK